MLLFLRKMVLSIALLTFFDLDTASLLVLLNSLVLATVEDLFTEFAEDDGRGAVAVVVEGLVHCGYLDTAL